MSSWVTEISLKKRKHPASSVKAAVFTLIVSLSGLLLTGCVDFGGTAEGSGDDTFVVKYTVGNPLHIKDVKEGNGTEFEYHYIKVSGLKDKGAEQRINERIKAVYDGLRVQDIPPYRGIKTRIPEDSILQNEAIYVNVTGNFNNILSVVFDKYVSYRDPDMVEGDPEYYDSGRYYSETETLNFDLNTGAEIKLKDLFRDSVDYMKLINDRMSRLLASHYADDEEYYAGLYDGIKQVESFKGLSEDQLFAISPHGITFIFDYRTPQFETGGAAAKPVLYFSEFSGNLALTKRFYNEDRNIYLSEAPPVKAFVSEYVPNDIVGTNYTDGDAVSIYQSWSYSSSLPEEIRARLEEARAVDRSKVEALKEICSKLPAGTEEAPGSRGAYEVMVHGAKVGPFYNIGRSTNFYLPDSSVMSSEYHCYDGETLKELKPEDIFRKGVDYRRVLDRAIRKAILDAGYTQAQGGAKLSEDYYAEALDGISGFNLQTDSLMIAVPDLAAQNPSGSMGLCIPYRDIGCDNLNIFNR